MTIHTNNIARLFAAGFTFLVVFLGRHHVTSFFEAIANGGPSSGGPASVLIGGALFCVALIATAGVTRIFFERN